MPALRRRRAGNERRPELPVSDRLIHSRLFTGPGGRVLKRVALAQINSRIAGRLAAADLKFRGDRIVLVDVVLRAPDGEQVASAGRVLLDLSIRALLRGRGELDRLEVAGYDLRLLRQPSGIWNLTAALAPTRPPRLPARPMPSMAVHQLVLERGQVQVLPTAQTGSSPAAQIALADLGFTGKVAYQRGILAAEVTGHGQLESLSRSPFTTDARLDLQDDAQTMRFSIISGEDVLLLTGRLPPGGRLTELASIAGRLARLIGRCEA